MMERIGRQFRLLQGKVSLLYEAHTWGLLNRGGLMFYFWLSVWRNREKQEDLQPQTALQAWVILVCDMQSLNKWTNTTANSQATYYSFHPCWSLWPHCIPALGLSAVWKWKTEEAFVGVAPVSWAAAMTCILITYTYVFNILPRAGR